MLGSNQVQESPCAVCKECGQLNWETNAGAAHPIVILYFYFHSFTGIDSHFARNGLLGLIGHSSRVKDPLLSFSLCLSVSPVPRVERWKPPEGDVLQSTAPPTETDLGSSPLHDECKQTILRRISAVRHCRQCTVSVHARRQSLKASEPDGGSRGDVSHRRLAPAAGAEAPASVNHRVVPSRYYSLGEVEPKLHFRI